MSTQELAVKAAEIAAKDGGETLLGITQINPNVATVLIVAVSVVMTFGLYQWKPFGRHKKPDEDEKPDDFAGLVKLSSTIITRVGDRLEDLSEVMDRHARKSAEDKASISEDLRALTSVVKEHIEAVSQEGAAVRDMSKTCLDYVQAVGTAQFGHLERFAAFERRCSGCHDAHSEIIENLKETPK